MQVLITRTTAANKQFVRAGTVIELNDYEARELILMGKAQPVDEPAPETAVEATDEPAAEAGELTTENAEAVVATTAPKGKRRGAK
jgi:hypothetical protein